MTVLWLWAPLAVLVASFVAGGEALNTESPGRGVVVDLGDSDLREGALAEGAWMLLFYAPWCGHCKKFMPEWFGAATKSSGPHLRYARVDCDVNKASCREFGVKGFPTVYFKDGPLRREFTGPKQADSVAQFARLMSRPAVVRLPTGTLAALAESEESLLVVFFGRNEDVPDWFVVEAVKRKGEVLFASTEDRLPGSVDQDASIAVFKEGTVVPFRRWEQSPERAFGQFLAHALRPLVVELVPVVFNEVMYGTHQVFLGVVDMPPPSGSGSSSSARAMLAQMRRAAARSDPAVLRFVLVNASRWDGFLEAHGAEVSAHGPSCALLLVGGGREGHYVDCEHCCEDEGSVQAFLARVNNGTQPLLGSALWHITRNTRRAFRAVVGDPGARGWAGAGVMVAGFTVLLGLLVVLCTLPATARGAKQKKRNSE